MSQVHTWGGGRGKEMHRYGGAEASLEVTPNGPAAGGSD